VVGRAVIWFQLILREYPTRHWGVLCAIGFVKMQLIFKYLFVPVSFLALSGCGGSSNNSDGGAYSPTGLPIDPYTNMESGPEPGPELEEIPGSSAASLACEEHDKQNDDPLRVAQLDLLSYPAYGDFVDSYATTASPPNFVFSGNALNTGSLLSLQANSLVLFCTGEVLNPLQCVSSNDGSGVDNGVLNLTWSDNNNGSSGSVTINDSNYGSGRVVVTEADGRVATSEWARTSDGVETFEYSDTTGTALEFTERPDCSGTVQLSQSEDSVLNFVTSTSWNSPESAVFRLSWEHCDYNSGEAVCQESEYSSGAITPFNDKAN